MRLVTYRSNVTSAARLGAIVDDFVVDLERLGAHVGQPLPSDMLEFIAIGPHAIDNVAALLTRHNGNWPLVCATPLVNVKLLAPIPCPRKNIFGIGLNYVEHVEESSRTLDTSRDLPKKPVVFSKPPTSVIGPGDAIEHNEAITRQLDWEGELAVVIGRRGKNVSERDALGHVFGYTIINDISARDNRRAGTCAAGNLAAARRRQRGKRDCRDAASGARQRESTRACDQAVARRKASSVAP